MAIGVTAHLTDLDELAPTVRHELVAPDEWARAHRFLHARDARRYLAARVALRRKLGERLARDPASIALVRGPHGKPHVAGDAVHFSISHCGAMLLAVIAAIPVGCDVEAEQDGRDLEAIAAFCFSQPERIALGKAPPGRRAAVFTDTWVRKEAYLKAIGTGMTTPMNSFDTADLAAAGWKTVTWAPAPGYRAAIVGAGAGWEPDLTDACLPAAAAPPRSGLPHPKAARYAAAAFGMRPELNLP